MRELTEALADDLDGSFERLVVSYQNRLYSFVLRMTGNAQDAEEVTQDAFVRAYGALQRYAPDRVRTLALRPWLYQIALNLSRNHARRYRPVLVPLDELEPRDPQGAVAQAWSGLDALARRAQREEIARALAALPVRYRASVALRHVEGLSYREIAAALEQPAGTIKANVHRGVRLLRRALRDRTGEV